MSIHFGKCSIFVFLIIFSILQRFSFGMDHKTQILGNGGSNSVVSVYGEKMAVAESNFILFYKRVGGTWQFQNSIILDEEPSDIDIYEDYAILGFPNYGNNRGRAIIYEFDSNIDEWKIVKSVYRENGEVNDYFGLSVAIHKDTAVVGSHSTHPTISSFAEHGDVTIFKRTEDVIVDWIKETDLTVGHEESPSSIRFGTSVSISDRYLVVGATRFNSEGAVFVFDRENDWYEIKLWNTGSIFFGKSVSLTDDYVVVGSPHDSINGELNSGSVFIFDISKGFEQTNRIFNGIRDQDFGRSVHISDKFIVVGGNTEAIFIYNKFNLSEVTKIDYEIDNSIQEKEFGSFVCSDGNTIVTISENFAYSFELGCLDIQCNKGSTNYQCECVCDNNWSKESNCTKCGLYCDLGMPDSICNECFGNEKYCFGLPASNQFVCSGNGNCSSFNLCGCEDGFSGNNCEITDSNNREENANSFPVWIIPITISVLLIVTVILCLFIVFIVIILLLAKKANRFNHIKNIEMIAKEAELEQKSNQNNPRISVTKKNIYVDFNEIKLLSLIGEGASSSIVYLASWKGEKIAYKGFKVSSDTSSFEEFEREVAICVNVKHPSILQFFGACVDPPKVGLLLEYCSFGDLPTFFYGYQKQNNKKYQIKEKIRLLKEIASGISYLHSRNIIHRDLKPENVLINENEKAKIMDFGLSIQKIKKDQTMTVCIGTSYYMSPEIIKGEKYSFSTDVYSFAILIFSVITENFSPYGIGINQTKILKNVANNPKFRPEIDQNLFEEFDCSFLIQIIKNNWDVDSTKRNTFDEIVTLLDNKK